MDHVKSTQHPYQLPYHWCLSPFHQYVVAQAVERVRDFISSKSVLDVGCGDGFTTALVARYASTVFGIDVNRRAIEFARLIVPDLRFEVGEAASIVKTARREGIRVEAITAFEVIEHLSPEELDLFLAGARELLTESDGVLAISTPNGGRRAGAKSSPYHEREYQVSELRFRLQDAGFGDVMTQGLYIQPPWSRIEHFANTWPFRAPFRALARAGRNHPEWCRTVICEATPNHLVANGWTR